MYHTIRASEDLLKCAIEKAIPGTELHAYLEEHLEEERQHEKWLAEDLLSVGFDVHLTSIPREAVQMAGSMFYLVRLVHPRALLGYMAVLEFFPMPLEAVEILEEIHGKSLLRCLRYHAEHDIDHAHDLAGMLDRLLEEEQELVFSSAIETALYQQAAVAGFNTSN
ncbi:hypothetical protein QN413_10925 [Variovorax sp. LG9.2]|nr:hypothetical protein [Variovorax sp. LG9.2]